MQKSLKNYQDNFYEKKVKGAWIPFTPGGSCLAHLASKTRKVAIKRLLEDAAHMPYVTWENFEKRGYDVEFIEGMEECRQ